MRYGIIGEDDSDVETLKVFIQNLAKKHGLSSPAFNKKGYNGWSEMFTKGVAQLKLFADLQCNRIVVCYDADGPSPKAEERREKIQKQLVAPSKVNIPCCALVPIQELEAWVLASIQSVTNVFASWRPSQSFAHPENIANPKEKLIKLSRDPKTRKARYSPPTHNPLVAKHLDLEEIEGKCPSFGVLVDFVTGSSKDRAKGRKMKRRRR
jgi:hypothetical protein